ncbi:MAG: hypothetical protein RL000_249 [Bacteroidota bacterium]
MALLLLKEEPDFKLGIWKIEEQMSFFADRISFQFNTTNAGRQLQQSATRFLLETLQERFPFADIENNEAGKPFISGNSMQFNLSHTIDLAAAITSIEKSVGIDAEKIHPRVLKIQHKFLNDVELADLAGKEEEEKILLLTKYWTIKEAVYKWWGNGGVDFAKDICIAKNWMEDEVVQVNFKKQQGIVIDVNCFKLDNHWVSYVVK